MAITQKQWERYFTLRTHGFNMASAAREAKISYASVKAKERGLRDSSGASYSEQNNAAASKLPGPIPLHQLSPVAADCLEDFERFRRRYLGHVSTPWQIETAQKVVEWLATPTKEFVVENCPPGTGKTTLIHDIGCWITARDRRIRGLIGSRIENNGRRTLRRIKRTLERTKPLPAKSEHKELGLAVDAEACMAADYGLFKPTTNDIWRADEFLVAQWDDVPVDEREPTWSCYGMDSGVLSNRFNFIAWDDVVDKATTRTLDAIQGQQLWWDDEAETRLEPGGLLWLVGQRMAAVDLYRYNLDKTVQADDDDEEEEELDRADRPKMYHHVVYRAHDESKCLGRPSHKKNAPAFPEGCLLDPYRLPWKELRNISHTKPRNYAISYQQEDVDPDDVLCRRVWIDGGIDPEDGTLAPGCWDENRDLCELPAGLVGRRISVATVDPSGKKQWALQWWVHTPDASEQTFLMDLERRAIPANELLDWDADNSCFVGYMEEWQARSVAKGLPITHWIVEVNAAQRYLLAYDHVRRWMTKWGVHITPHTTGPRKLDEDHGPWILRNQFRFGKIRLPGKQSYGIQERSARVQSMKLIDEVTKWPNAGTTDDQVMGAWFLYRWLPQLVKSATPTEGKLWTPPSWVKAS